MLNYIRTWAVVIGLSLSNIANAANPAPPPPESLEALDRQLAAIFEHDHIPGASVALIEHGQVVFAKGYGYADVARRIPASPDTPFRAGSISKAITSIAVMTLAERGKLSLDAPIAGLVPQVRFVNPWEASDPVRLAEVLEHTTGWPDIGPRLLAKDDAAWSDLQGVRFASPDYVSRWKPGYFTLYDNAGPPVAAIAIENVTGESFEAYAREAVLRPMGMPTADFDLTPSLAARIARSYGPNGAVTPYQNIVLKPAGSLNVSARELAQLVRFYIGRGTVDGRQILTPRSVARIERGETNLGARFGFTGAYGLGNTLLPDSGITFRGHNGQIDSFTAVIGYTLRNGSGYVLMANGGEGVDFARPAAHLVQTYLTRGLPLDPPPTLRLNPAALRAYAGFYRPVTPPNALLIPYTQTLRFNVVKAAADRLLINGQAWIPVGPHSFRRFDRDTASTAFVEDGGRFYKIGPFGAEVKTPLWRIIAIFAVAALIPLAGIIGVAMLIPWLVSYARGRLAGRGGLAVRVLPLVGVTALMVNYALPLAELSAPGAEGARRLAEIGPYSLILLACSLIYPTCGAVGLALALRARAAGPLTRGYACVASGALLCVTAYAVNIGWFAMRTWTM